MFLSNKGIDYQRLTYQRFKSDVTFQQHMEATAAKYKKKSDALLCQYHRYVQGLLLGLQRVVSSPQQHTTF
jgi:DNA-binding transcriptional MocR family regulator